MDCSCLLYKARGAGLSPLTVVASLIVRLRKANIEPVFIFDGRPPAAKSEVVDQRRIVRQAVHKEMAEIRANIETKDLTLVEAAEMERRHAALQKKAPSVSGGDKDELKKLLYAAGVQFTTASGEADDVLGYLCRTGVTRGVVSSDMDMLARGVPCLIIPETNDATVLTEIVLADVLTGLGLQYPQFVDACMLMGSDYSGKGWRPVEPKTAIALAKKGVDWASVDVSGTVCLAMEHGVALLTGTGIHWEEIVSEKQRVKWDLGRPPSEPETLAAMAVANGWPVDWVRNLGTM